MKTYNTKNTRSGRLSFYLVLAMCAAMIGVSCWFAYTQTSEELTLELDSALDSAQDFRTMEKMTENTTQAPAATEPAAASPMHYKEDAPETEPEAPVQQAAAVLVPPTEAPAETAAAPSQNPRYPVNGEVLKPYSGGELVKSETTGIWQTHNGVDLACTIGDPVFAMDKGIVSDITKDPLWGVCVTIDHQNSVFSRYCGLQEDLEVSVGDAVTPDTILGAAGNTADVESAMDPHLHFEVMQGEQYLDPASYICES